MRSWRRLFPADKNDKLLSLQNIFVTFEEIKDLYYLSFLHIYSTTGRQLVQRQRLGCGSLSGFFSKKSWHVLPYRTKMFWVSSFAFFFFFLQLSRSPLVGGEGVPAMVSGIFWYLHSFKTPQLSHLIKLAPISPKTISLESI